jgi:hypothetical protein
VGRAALIFWPTSALLGQDETIAAVLRCRRDPARSGGHRLAAACAVLVLGLFVAKVFLLAVLLAFCSRRPASERRRAWTVSAVGLAALAAVTWLFSGTDGISQQLRTRSVPRLHGEPVVTLLLHHDVSGNDGATTGPVVLASVAAVVVLALWWCHRGDPRTGRGAPRCPRCCWSPSRSSQCRIREYLCIAAPLVSRRAVLR